jgi:hypothetical protein
MQTNPFFVSSGSTLKTADFIALTLRRCKKGAFLLIGPKAIKRADTFIKQ